MGVCCCDRAQGFSDDGIQCLAGPRLGRARGGLELRPAALNRRQIRRIGWQKQEPRAGLLNGLADARRFVRPQVVYDDDVPRMPRGAELLLDIRAKHLGVRGALDRHHGLDALAPERREHRHMRPIMLGDSPELFSPRV
jgi:hypothetical protein